MGIQDLQALLENEGVSVDLFRIGRNHTGGFRLLVDAEGCLDRLYGGYFSDWACGGQWARCVQFFVSLKAALAEHQVSVCICFNGTHPITVAGAPLVPPAQWAQQQAANRQKINSVLRHIAAKGTPPPKVWWVPPAGLHSCLRTALRHLNIPMMVTTDDHHQEVVGLCRERGYAGLLGCAGEYLAFQPPRYFCSSRLKLTYRSSLETKEFMVHDLAQWLEIPQDKICIVAALLGNNILTEQHLGDFHKRLSNNQKKLTGETLVRSVATYIRDFANKDLDALCVDIFGNANDNRCPLLKQSIQYYVNGTKDGFLKYKNTVGWKQKLRKPILHISKEVDMDTSRLASEANKPEIGEFKLGNVSCSGTDWSEGVRCESTSDNRSNVSASASMSAKTSAPTLILTKDVTKLKFCNTILIKSPITPFPIEVLRTCSERHSKGLMSPSLLTLFMHRQITLPVLLEDETHRELPSIHHLFQPIRQNIYAIIFNMHHYHFMATRNKEGEKSTSAPPVNISEWIYSRRNPGRSSEIVPGIMLDWPVPTVQRLWFGTAQDDKNRRIRAFLSCMRSENPLMTNTSYVPQHLMLFATVLRYIMTSQVQCLRRHELDAFLATAFATDLMNPLPLQEMTLSAVTVRGVQLGALIMTGIETALLANDACGAPIWWPFTSPWIFFDGKLFQHKLARANSVKNLVQLCDNQVDIVIKVERMRKAILEGLNVEFAIPPLPMNPSLTNIGYPPPGVLGWVNPKGRGNLNTTHRVGGRLEIAGVVVGQWGANYARSAQPRYAPQLLNMPQIGYSTYPSQQSTFSHHSPRGRGISRGRGVGVTTRGGLSRRTRHRTTRPTAPRRRSDNNTNAIREPTISINGKVLHGEEIKNLNGATNPLPISDALVDSTTDSTGQQEQTSDNGESPDSQFDNTTSSNGVNKPKSGKNFKKTVSKGKKKGTQKTESPAKPEDIIKVSENNGQLVENHTTIKNKIPGKPVSIVNGGNESNGDHKSQGESALDG